MYDRSRVAFLDIETTGLHPYACDTWEVAFITDENEFCFQHRIKSDARVDEWVKDNGRFTENYDKFNAYSDSAVADIIDEHLSGKHLVGACPWFDADRL